MDMFASMRRFTRDDLRKAFDEYAEAHGHERAALALHRTTGAQEVSAVPDGRIINAMVELIGGYSFVARGPSARPRYASSEAAEKFYAALKSIGERAFAKRNSL